ncbi:hypothetical protein WJX81_002788 [Elliptochloris bilobata]|uniref:Uncharacterized protein n=1 Tax=Elliptochloris bilobata TaxID=381761 RepID=A0AAW1RE94_9CHLO
MAAQQNVFLLVREVFRALEYGKLPSPALFRQLLSKALGYGIILSACVIKVPQITAIARAGSARGLSGLALELEQLGLTVNAANGYVLGLPFSAYGEAVVILAQNTVLLAQVYALSGTRGARPALVAALFLGGVGAVLAGLVSPALIRTLFGLNVFVNISARLPQILQNYKAKSTGELSIITFAANFLGGLARIFTSIQEGGGLSMARAYVIADIQWQRACLKVVRRLLKTVAIRQVMGILAAMTFVRFGLEPLVKVLRRLFRAQGVWEKSSEFYILREVYRPLEFLFAVAAFTTLAENFLPQLIALPKAMVQNLLELKGDLTKQRRVEAVDKLLSVLTLLVGTVFGLQAIGLDVNSVLAIGGVGGLAVGLAGREILENLFTGLIILSSSPFEVGDEVLFTPPSGSMVEGIVLDVGWYRTTIRSFERELYNIPNSVFSRNVVLNVTRKNKEWRFYEFIGLRVDDVGRAGAVVADMRKIIRQDPRIIQKLHRRVFIDKLTREQISVYVSFYVEATNRDAYMAIKQDLLLAFIDCVERNGAKLAKQLLLVEVVAQALPAGRGTAAAGAAAPADAPQGGDLAGASSNVVPRGDPTREPLRQQVAAAAANLFFAEKGGDSDSGGGGAGQGGSLVTASFDEGCQLQYLRM